MEQLETYIDSCGRALWERALTIKAAGATKRPERAAVASTSLASQGEE